MAKTKLPVFQAILTDDENDGVQSIEIVKDPLPDFEFVIIKEDGETI